MEKKEFSTVHLNHLSNEDAAALFVQTCEHAIPVKDYLDDVTNKALANLQSSSADFSAQANRPQKSKLTDEVAIDRKVSSDILSEIKRVIVFESKSRDAGKKKSAQDFNFFFEPYSKIGKAPIGTQIEQTQEMILKYKADPLLLSAAQIINIDVLMTELETDNTKLSVVYKIRTTDTGNRKTSSTDLRPATTENYVMFCNIVEQAVNLMPNDALLSLFNTLNELRKKYNALISKPKDKGKNTPTA